MSRRSIIQRELQRVDGISPTEKDPLLKHRTMAQNPFRFMRGAASLFYADLKSGVLPVPDSLLANGLNTSIVGDCHVSNFGFLSEEGSHGDSVIFAPNDFDDACIGNAIWDIYRFLLSLNLTQLYCQGIISGDYESEVVDPDNMPLAVTDNQTLKASQSFLESYLCTCEAFINEEHSAQSIIAEFPKRHVLHTLEKKANKRAAGGKQFTKKSALAKATERTDSHIRFKVIEDKFKPVSAGLKKEIIDKFGPYVDDTILDVTERLGAGTGSINMHRYYLLVGPDDYQGEVDLSLCHIVEIKKQRVAAPIMHFEDISPINRLNPAHLTVVCQQRMQRRPDLVLDEREWRNAHWLVRSRHHSKVGVKPEQIGMANDKTEIGLNDYAVTCAKALALAHCRGDRRSTRFERAILQRLPNEKQTVIDHIAQYTVQTQQDWQLLTEMLST